MIYVARRTGDRYVLEVTRKDVELASMISCYSAQSRFFQTIYDLLMAGF